MKKIRYTIIVLAILCILIYACAVITDHTYLYKGITQTYLKGRTGPAIDEYGIFSNREIKNGSPQPWPKGYNFNKINIPDNHTEIFKQYHTIAFLVLKDDSLRYEKYWDDYGPGSFTNSFSMAKTVVSVLTGIALSENKIKSLDEPAGDFLPEFSADCKAAITIRHLLTMSTGLDFDESYMSPFAYPAKGYYGEDLKTLTLKYDCNIEPGRVFEYLSGNTQVLGFVLEKATGMKISEYASEKLWKPLGAENSALWSLDHADGDEKAFCCINSNARDFARIGFLYLKNGNWMGSQIVPEEYVKQSVQPAPLIEKDGQVNIRYGHSWWLLKYRDQDIFYAQGINGQYVAVLPQKNVVMVRLGKKRSLQKTNGHHDDFYQYLDIIIDSF